MPPEDFSVNMQRFEKRSERYYRIYHFVRIALYVAYFDMREAMEL